MLTKEEILQQVKVLSATGVLAKDELLAAYDERLGKSTEKSKAAKILYYLGGGIVFLGISIFLGQHWPVLNSVTKISSTLGTGIAAYYLSLFVATDKRTKAMSVAFALISALVTPIGLYVTFDIAGYNTQSYGLQSLIFAILFIVYLLSQFILKEKIFLLFSVIFASSFFYHFNYFLITDAPYFIDWNLYGYLILVIGLSYLLLGNYFCPNGYRSLAWFFYGLGSLFFLAGAFLLGDWKPDQNLFWESIFLVLVFGMLFASVRVKSRAMLSISTFFLMVYLIKITAEYFSNSLGWPLAMVVAGLLVIAAGYLFFTLKKSI
jgi:MFS family permease